jgi:hypothetical protein
VSERDPFIVIGTLVRPHGFPREGVSHFKANFDFPGHETLPERSSVWILDGAAFREFALAAPSSPLGGKWSQATGAKLSFFEKDIASLAGGLAGRKLALPRSSFAPLDGSEVYLCDLQGVEVRAEDGTRYGCIEGAVSVGKGAWNLTARSGKKPFEFPLKWIDWTASQIERAQEPRFVVVPNVAIWVDIEALEAERDDD